MSFSIACSSIALVVYISCWFRLRSANPFLSKKNIEHQRLCAPNTVSHACSMRTVHEYITLHLTHILCILFTNTLHRVSLSTLRPLLTLDSALSDVESASANPVGESPAPAAPQQGAKGKEGKKGKKGKKEKKEGSKMKSPPPGVEGEALVAWRAARAKSNKDNRRERKERNRVVRAEAEAKKTKEAAKEAKEEEEKKKREERRPVAPQAPLPAAPFAPRRQWQGLSGVPSGPRGYQPPPPRHGGHARFSPHQPGGRALSPNCRSCQWPFGWGTHCSWCGADRNGVVPSTSQPPPQFPAPIQAQIQTQTQAPASLPAPAGSPTVSPSPAQPARKAGSAKPAGKKASTSGVKKTKKPDARKRDADKIAALQKALEETEAEKKKLEEEKKKAEEEEKEEEQRALRRTIEEQGRKLEEMGKKMEDAKTQSIAAAAPTAAAATAPPAAITPAAAPIATPSAGQDRAFDMGLFNDRLQRWLASWDREVTRYSEREREARVQTAEEMTHAANLVRMARRAVQQGSDLQDRVLTGSVGRSMDRLIRRLDEFGRQASNEIRDAEDTFARRQAAFPAPAALPPPAAPTAPAADANASALALTSRLPSAALEPAPGALTDAFLLRFLQHNAPPTMPRDFLRPQRPQPQPQQLSILDAQGDVKMEDLSDELSRFMLPGETGSAQPSSLSRPSGQVPITLNITVNPTLTQSNAPTQRNTPSSQTAVDNSSETRSQNFNAGQGWHEVGSASGQQPAQGRVEGDAWPNTLEWREEPEEMEGFERRIREREEEPETNPRHRS